MTYSDENATFEPVNGYEKNKPLIRLLPPAHQVMQGIIPGLEKVVIGIVNKIRQTAHNPDQTFPAQEIGIYTQKTEFLEKYGHNLVRRANPSWRNRSFGG